MTSGLVGAVRHPADAVGRLRGRHLPVSVPGHDFAERDAAAHPMTSSDAGVSFHYNLPSNYGDFHVGVYNGENYTEVGSQRSEGVRVPRHAPAVRARARRCCGPARAPRLLQRPLRQETTSARARHGQRHFRAPVPERRLRLPRAPTDQTLGDGDRSVEQRLFVLGDAADADGQRRVVRSAASLRPPHAEHSTTLAPPTSPIPASRVQRSAAEPDDRRRAYWFPHQGNVSTRDSRRLRRPERSTTSRRAPTQSDRRARADQFLTEDHIDEASTRVAGAPRARCGRSSAGVAAAADDADQRRRAPRSRTRSTRSGSTSTTSCTRTCRSTTSRSARAAASGRSPTRRCSSAPPTAR